MRWAHEYDIWFGLVTGPLAGLFFVLWFDASRRLRRIQRQARPRPPMVNPQAEFDYIGGMPELGERAIVDAYVRVLDNLWRMRTGMHQASPFYVIEKAELIQQYAGELASLVQYWTAAAATEDAPPIRWDLLMRAVKARGLWSGSHVRALHVIEPLPWDMRPEEPPSVTCPECFLTSYNPSDIRLGFCGRCAVSTSIGTSGYDLRPAELKNREAATK